MKLIRAGKEFDFWFESGDVIVRVSPRGFANEYLDAVVLTSKVDTSAWDNDPDAWTEMIALTAQQAAQRNWARLDTPLWGRFRAMFTPHGFYSGQTGEVTADEVESWIIEMKGG